MISFDDAETSALLAEFFGSRVVEAHHGLSIELLLLAGHRIFFSFLSSPPSDYRSIFLVSSVSWQPGATNNDVERASVRRRAPLCDIDSDKGFLFVLSGKDHCDRHCCIVRVIRNILYP